MNLEIPEIDRPELAKAALLLVGLGCVASVVSEGSKGLAAHTLFVDRTSTASLAFSVRVCFQGPVTDSTEVRESCVMESKRT